MKINRAMEDSRVSSPRQESLLRDGCDLESAMPFESLSAKQQGRFQQETWRCSSVELLSNV